MNIVISPKFQKRNSIKEKDIDFLPVHIRVSRTKKKKAVSFSIFGVLLAVGLYFLYIYPQGLIREYERELAVENNLIQNLERGKEVYDRLQAKKAKHDTMSAAIGEIEKQRFEALELMDKIGSALPRGVMISKLSLLPNKVSLTVVSASPIDTARVVVALRKQGIFKEVELPSAPMLQEPKEVSFELALKDKPPETKSASANLMDNLKDFARKFIFKEGEGPGWLTGDNILGKAQKLTP